MATALDEFSSTEDEDTANDDETFQHEDEPSLNEDEGFGNQYVPLSPSGFPFTHASVRS
jgi:hypothetical protein